MHVYLQEKMHLYIYVQISIFCCHCWSSEASHQPDLRSQSAGLSGCWRVWGWGTVAVGVSLNFLSTLSFLAAKPYHCGVLSPVPGWPPLTRLLFRLLFCQKPSAHHHVLSPPTTFPPHLLTSFLFPFYFPHDTRHVLFPHSFVPPTRPRSPCLGSGRLSALLFIHHNWRQKRARTQKGIQVTIHHCNSL